MIYQLSSPLQADLERPTLTPSSIAGKPVVYSSVHNNGEVGPKMLQGELLGTCLQPGQAALLSSALIRDGEMLLQQS